MAAIGNVPAGHRNCPRREGGPNASMTVLGMETERAQEPRQRFTEALVVLDDIDGPGSIIHGFRTPAFEVKVTSF